MGERAIYKVMFLSVIGSEHEADAEENIVLIYCFFSLFFLDVWILAITGR